MDKILIGDGDEACIIDWLGTTEYRGKVRRRMANSKHVPDKLMIAYHHAIERINLKSTPSV